MGEVFFIIGLIGFLILPFQIIRGNSFVAKIARIFWTITMSVIGCVVVGAEIIGKVTQNLTISRMYWNWSLENEGWSWVVTGLLLIGWLNLLVHLQWKVIKRRLVSCGWIKE